MPTTDTPEQDHAPPRYTRAAGRPSKLRVSPRPPILIVPGLHNSGPEHWQSYWERTFPNARRIDQADWDRPDLAAWTRSLAQAVRQQPGAVLVAHSLGCALVAHLCAIDKARGIGGAMLVAPVDVDAWRPALHGPSDFSPMPRQRLPFPSIVVASQNDPYVEIRRAEAFAKGWGSQFIDLGLAGHINAASGHGPWLKGQAMLRGLVGQINKSRVF
jgi:predicted alpha/beta hydrolase family esterase